MTLVALSVAQPREIEIKGQRLWTGIYKRPVRDRRWVSATNIEGDGQADLSVHGGPEKAVYVYPSEHYATWADELGRTDLTPGAFGENLTTTGLVETSVAIGDRFRIGSAEFVVTQPRMPCVKLAIKMGRADMIKRFTSADRSGFYVAVEQEGEIGAGDAIEWISRDSRRFSVAAAYRLKIDGGSRDALRAAADHPALSVGWRESFRRRAEEA